MDSLSQPYNLMQKDFIDLSVDDRLLAKAYIKMIKKVSSRTAIVKFRGIDRVQREVMIFSVEEGDKKEWARLIAL